MYQYTAFEDFQKIVSGDLNKVLVSVKKRLNDHQQKNILIFSDDTGKQMDFDLSGSEAEILEKHKIYTLKTVMTRAVVGRPKLGVVPREISLLPNHWEWLNIQTGGASATIRQLIEEKMKVNETEKLKAKRSQEVTYKFLTAIAGDLPHFEDSIRFLYRSDRKKFTELISQWPADIVEHSLKLAEDAF